MKLILQTSYLSIKELPPTELPPFTLITGVNGAGKTHLLKAIQAGNIQVDCAPNVSTDIRFFDWTTLVPQDTELFDGHLLVRERSSLIEQYEQAVQRHADQIIAVARQVGISGAYLSDPAALATFSQAKLTQILGDPAKAAQAATILEGAAKAASQNLMGDHRLGNIRRSIERVAHDAQRYPIALRREDFIASVYPSWGQAELFQQSLGRLFVAYRDLALANQVKQLQKVKGRIDVSALSDEEFTEKFMIAPWQFVNQAFKASGLDFVIDHPEEFDTTPYQPKLRKLSSNAEILFSGLSSGEKIIMSFALCLYYAQDKRQVATYPKLLLLDEIDAPLHPSMSRTLVRIVTETLVKEHGINVIAATHSPSTVAVAPEGAIYVMHPDRAGLHKTTKAQALNILTVGVPTLAISWDGRRQVFVESPNDAHLYDAIYQILKPRLGSERSLEFIATGATEPTTGMHSNTGCEVVRRLVAGLSEAGNNTVYGLIDWDGKNKPAPRVAVVAEGRRDGLENLILDPLLIAALVVRDARDHLNAIGLEPSNSYLTFLGYTPVRLQPVVELVQKRVLKNGANSIAEVDASYLGNFSLRLRDAYLKTDDHKLEELILEAFPPLKGFSKSRAGALMKHIVGTVLIDQPNFIPAEFFDILTTLLQQPSHAS